MTNMSIDIKKDNIDKTKKNIIKNLIKTRQKINDTPSLKHLIREYDDYFNQIQNEKYRQIKLLNSILEYLEKLNNNDINLVNNSILILNDINKIKNKLNELHKEISNFSKRET